MQNIELRFNATSNFAPVHSDMARLRAEAGALEKTLRNTAFVSTPGAVDPKKWRVASVAAAQASQTFRNAAASSGLFNAQQIRAVSEADRFTKALQKQKVSLADIRKNRSVFKEIYNDQLRMRRMAVQTVGVDASGRQIMDVVKPKMVPTELDTWRNKMGMFSALTKSAGEQMINLGKNVQWAGRQLTVGFTYPAVLMGAGSAMVAYQVENQMAQINKVYDISAEAQTNEAKRTQELNALRADSFANAKKIAQDYGLTMQKTLGVEQQLAATGLTGKPLLGATREVQRISMLGDIDPTQTTDMVVALQTAFKSTIKDGDDLTETLNFMNAVSNATSLSLQDIAEATPRAASGLSQLGVNAKQMTVLLVSMREAGVDAAEGANALKSATTRLLNPAIVNKAAEIYKAAGASFDLRDIVKQSKGNLYDFINLLGDVTSKEKNLTAEQKASAVAALFGTYQFNRLNAAIVNMGEAQRGANNQTAKAKELFDESAASMANMAKNSEKAITESGPGKLRIAWASFLVEVAKFGEPFLKVIAGILDAGTNMAEAFNGLPGIAKGLIFTLLGFAAVAGPLLMVTGLIANLGGQMIKGAGIMTGLFSKGFKILTTNESATALALQNASQKMIQQGSAAERLRFEIEALAGAYNRANVAAASYAGAKGIPMVGPGGIVGTPGPRGTDPRLADPAFAAAYNSVGSRYPAGTPPLAPGRRAPGGQPMPEAERLRRAEALLATEQRTTQAVTQTTAQRVKGQAAAGATAASMGIMAVSTAVLMTNSEGTAHNIAKWALIGSLVVPAAYQLLVLTKAAAVAAFKYATNMRMGALTNAALASRGTGALVKGLTALMSPVGLISAAVVGIGVGLFAWSRHIKKAREEQERLKSAQESAQAGLITATDKWAKNVGLAYTNYKKYNLEGDKALSSEKAKEYNDTVKQFRSQKVATGNGDGEKVSVGEQFNASTENIKQFTITNMLQKFYALGLSADDAKMRLTAFFEAAGVSGEESAYRIERAMSSVGTSIDGANWDNVINQAIAAIKDASGNEELIKSTADSVGKFVLTAFDSVKTPEAKARLTEQLKELISASASSAQAEAESLISKYDLTKNAALVSMGGNQGGGAVAIMEQIISKKKTIAELDKQEIAILKSNSGFKEFATIAQGAKDSERAFLKEFGTSLRLRKEDYKSLDAILDSFTFKLAGATTKTQRLSLTLGEQLRGGRDAFGSKGMFGRGDILSNIMNGASSQATWNKNDIIGQVAAYSGPLGEFASQIRRTRNGLMDLSGVSQTTLGQIREGLKGVKKSDLPEFIVKFLEEVEKNDPTISFFVDDSGIDKAKAALNSLPSNKNIGITITGDQVKGILKDSMSTMQGDMADSAMSTLGAKWDARMQGQERANSNAQKAFEARWEKRKKALEDYYDKRKKGLEDEIKGEQKADEERSKMFDRERERIRRLAELTNNTIDYNQALNEGRVDDAAKIANDQQASNYNNAIDDAQKSAEERSAAVQEKLQTKIDALEARREKRLARLDKLQQKASEHMQQAQQAQIAGMNRMRQQEEANLQQRLALFRAYVPSSIKDLEEWMKKTGLSYDTFGKSIKDRGQSWSVVIRDALAARIREAGTKISSDNMWEAVGGDMINQLIKGMGFSSLTQFQRFVGMKPTKTQPNVGGKRPGSVPGDGPSVEGRHEGGMIGTGSGSRKGVNPRYKGLHRSEQMVLAQKGEYVVNSKAAKENQGLLDSINSGTNGVGIMGGAGWEGPGAVVAAAAYKMFEKGVTTAIQSKVSNQRATDAGALAGSLGIGASYAGKAFGDWSSEQMRNAATIASVGSGLGMSTRDIQIGIMTAIAESGLKNVNYGDRDSVGLFQQRTSQGWGTIEQIMNPRYSAGKFFSALKGVKDRNAMSPWAAAQAVQRSAFADGSNYAKWWKSAKAIYSQGLRSAQSGPGSMGGFVAGSGGKHRPINAGTSQRLHGGNTPGNPPAYDFSAPRGTPVYAVSDGVITQSRDIRGPLASDRYRGDGPYGSFGRMIQMRTDGGAYILYAHLSKRSADAGQRVRGGSVIGYSGNTGNSSGPHLHFGATNGPAAWLKKGGLIRHDNTPAILHKGETVLTSALTQQFRDNVASGGGDTYDVTIDLRGAVIRDEIDIENAVNKAIDKKALKTGISRKVGG